MRKIAFALLAVALVTGVPALTAGPAQACSGAAAGADGK